MHEFRTQRNVALGFGAVVSAWMILADLLVQRMHELGWMPALSGWIDSVSYVLQFGGFSFVQVTHIRTTHHTTGWVWVAVVAFSGVFWTVFSRLLLGILFPLHQTANKKREPGGADASLDPAAPAGISRRDVMTAGARTVFGAGVALAAYSTFSEPHDFKITRRIQPLRGLAPELDGLRIIQLSDIHHGPNLTIEYVRKVIAAANALHPDVVLLTGDYVYESPDYIEPTVAELNTLRPAIGAVAVLGNHDWWEDAPRTREAFEKTNIPLIDNTRIFVTPDRKLSASASNGLCIAGVGDYLEDRQDYDAALGGVNERMPRLLLSHNPDVAEDSRLVDSKLRVDLMLAGHTHGGQIWIPGLGTPIIPSRFGQKYASGLVAGPAFPVYVNRGIGTTVLPMRFCVPPEITMMTLKSV